MAEVKTVRRVKLSGSTIKSLRRNSCLTNPTAKAEEVSDSLKFSGFATKAKIQYLVFISSTLAKLCQQPLQERDLPSKARSVPPRDGQMFQQH